MLNIRTQPSLYRDFALLSVFILFMLLLVSIWVAYETYEDHSEKVIKQLENEAVKVDRALIVEIENAAYLLESVGRQISHFGYEDLDTIYRIFQSFDKQDYVKNSIFSWVRSDQMLVVSSNKGVLQEPIDVADRDYLKKALADPWKVKIGRPIQGRVSEKWVIPVAMGLTDFDGNYVGAVLISLDIDSLTKSISSVIKESGINFAITNTAFTLLTQVSDSQNFYSKYFDIKALDQINFDDKPNGVYTHASFFGDDHIYSYYERSSRYPYVILLGYDQSLNNSAIREILFPRLFQLVVIAIFLLLVLWTVRNRIIQPVIDLTRNTADIVRGGTSQTLGYNGPLEIEELAQEIKRLGDYIEERKRIERELRNKNAHLNKIKESAQLTNKAKADFLESVSKELLIPLSIISENAETLRGQHFGPLDSKYQQNANEITHCSNDMMAMIDDIRAISEAESGIVALNDSDVDVPFALQKCIRLLRDKAQFYDVEVIVHADEHLPQLIADELRLKQILLNLLSGAANYMAPEDAITVNLYVKNKQFCIDIEYMPKDSDDEHTGFRPQAFRAALDIVRKDEKSGDYSQSGGLGIALTRLLVSMHQGALDIKNKNNRLTVMTVRFPKERIAS